MTVINAEYNTAIGDSDTAASKSKFKLVRDISNGIVYVVMNLTYIFDFTRYSGYTVIQ